MSGKQAVYDKLKELDIPCRAVEHDAVFTVEEMSKLEFPPEAVAAKNLFLRDAKGKRHFLVTARAHQPVDLKALEGALGSTKLSFASEERLGKHLKLTKGSVTPLGLLNDPQGNVEFYLHDELRHCGSIGVHPNDNTATVFLSGASLIRFVEATGHTVNFVHLSE